MTEAEGERDLTKIYQLQNGRYGMSTSAPLLLRFDLLRGPSRVTVDSPSWGQEQLTQMYPPRYLSDCLLLPCMSHCKPKTRGLAASIREPTFHIPADRLRI